LLLHDSLQFPKSSVYDFYLDANGLIKKAFKASFHDSNAPTQSSVNKKKMAVVKKI